MPRRLLLFAAALALPACGGTTEPAPTPVATAAPATPAPESANAEANTLFMDARTKGLDRSRQSITGAMALLERAVRLDPTFTRAYAELALACGTIDLVGGGE